jgi:hypothetical protein
MRIRDRRSPGCFLLAAIALPVLLTCSKPKAEEKKPAPIGNANVPAQAPGDVTTAAQQEAVAQGLEWLANRQKGLAGGDPFRDSGYANHAGITALAGLAFMQAGNLPGRGKYGAHVQKCLDYVLQCGQLTGLIAAPENSAGPMYGHGLATIFLAEVYAMTGDEGVKEKLSKAVHLIESVQNTEGGWRYQPAPYDADISNTVFQIMALRAARDAGIRVDSDVIARAIRYVRRCQNKDGGFSYTAVLAGPIGYSAFPRSAAGLCALCAGGGQAKEIELGIAYVKQCKPPNEQLDFGHFYYCYYYATQTAFFAGGEFWKDFYPAIRDDLIRRREREHDHWSGDYSDEYATSMALLILQMPNRRPSEARLQAMIDGLAEKTGQAPAAMPGEIELRFLRRYQQYLNDRTRMAGLKTPSDENEMRSLRAGQDAIRGVYDHLIQKITNGKQKLAPPPDFKSGLPADPKKWDIENDLEYGRNDPTSVRSCIQLIGDRLAHSSARLAANDAGPIAQGIQRRLLLSFDVLIQISRQIDLSKNFEWSANGFDRLEGVADAIAALQDLRDRQAKLEERFRLANGRNLAKMPRDLNDADMGANDAMAQEQKTLARQTDEALRQIDRAAKKLNAADPAKQAMTKAADAGRKLNLSARQREAAEDMRENLQAMARERQRAVEAGLDQIIAVLKESNGADGIRDSYVRLRESQKEIGIALQQIDAAARASGGELPRQLEVKLRLLPDKQDALISTAEKIAGRVKSLNNAAYDRASDDILKSLSEIRENLAKPDTGGKTQAAAKRAEEQIRALIGKLAR